MASITHLGLTADDFYRKLNDALGAVFEASGSVFNDEAQAAMLVYDRLLRDALGLPEIVRH